MKKLLLLVLAMLFLFSLPLFANFTEEELIQGFTKVEIEKALADYKAGTFDENGSLIYKKAMDELNAGAIKSGRDEEHFILGVLAVLFASSISRSIWQDAVSACINRCVRWYNLPYHVCRADCRYDPHSY